MTSAAAPGSAGDPELDQVEQRLYELDPDGKRVATVLRDTLDQLYDGQRSGHWSPDQRRKTEKTHLGTLVEINLHREFEFDDGDKTDYRIAGVEVDCKFSMKPWAWMLPPESIGHLCLVLWASEMDSVWSAGLVRVDPACITAAKNRDAKRRLTTRGRSMVRGLWTSHGRLAENLLLHLDDVTRTRIFAAKARRGNKHGQARVNELFRVEQQDDRRAAEIAGVLWALAVEDEPVAPAPEVPRKRKREQGDED